MNCCSNVARDEDVTRSNLTFCKLVGAITGIETGGGVTTLLVTTGAVVQADNTTANTKRSLVRRIRSSYRGTACVVHV